MVVAALNIGLPFSSVASHYSCDTMALSITSYQCSSFFLQPSLKCWHIFKSPICLAAISRNISSEPDSSPSQNPNSKPKRSSPRRQISKVTENKEKDPGDVLPITKPKKPRRGRRSEAAAVEDFLRDKLEQTLTSIKEQNPKIFKDRESILKERIDDDSGSDDSTDYAHHDNGSVVNSMVVDQEDPNWPPDADVGWGTRASEFFEKYPIKNVVGEDGFEIDWEGEIDNGLVKEINCLEWESFAFHPSPLVVLVFERYNRSSENWKALKELEKAAEVYWKAKDRLPPRTIKLDINIEKDLAYALKVKECPQILFLRGNQIMYREKEMRTAEELLTAVRYLAECGALDIILMDVGNLHTAHFEDMLPVMAQKLGGEGLIRELCNGFQLLMDSEKRLITFGSLKKSCAVLGLQDFQDEEIEVMIKEGDLDGDGALNQLEFCILMFRLSPELMNGAGRLLEE